MIIYKITNQINGKIYIGQTIKSLQHRKAQHIKAAEKGVDRHLYRAMRKYGIDNFKFEEIYMASSLDELNYLEAKYILEYDSVRTGYNMGYGGDNNVMFSDVVKSKHDTTMRREEVRSKISKSMIEYRRNNPFTSEHRKRLSNSMQGNRNGVGSKLSAAHKEALNRSHYKVVYCIDQDSNIIARFDTVQKAAEWWFNNGYNTVKNWKNLCNTIKQSNKQNKFVRGLKWIYEGGDVK